MKKQLLHIPGAVIDPETKKLCALQIDLAKALNISSGQIASQKKHVKIYQGKFLDVDDVLSQRENLDPRGRKARKGFVSSTLVAAIIAAVVGVTAATSVLSSGQATTGILTEAVERQEMVVSLAEQLGTTGAAEARKQWERNKEIALGRISDLENIEVEEN